MTTTDLDEDRHNRRIRGAETIIADRAVNAEDTLHYCLRLLATDGDEHDRHTIRMLLNSIRRRRELTLRATAARAARGCRA